MLSADGRSEGQSVMSATKDNSLGDELFYSSLQLRTLRESILLSIAAVRCV